VQLGAELFPLRLLARQLRFERGLFGLERALLLRQGLAGLGAFSTWLLSASLLAARASRSCSTWLYRTVETQAGEAPPTMAPAAIRARARTCAERWSAVKISGN